jgi:predicted transcriptional regulator
MKSIKSLSPEAFKLLGDETRKKMVFLLRVKEMTVSQLAGELHITPQAIYHHLKKLLTKEMVEVTREERVGHLIESYYQATAEAFISTSGPACCGITVDKERALIILNTLKKLGFEIEISEDKLTQLVDVQAELDNCCSSGKFDDAVSQLEDIDFLTKPIIVEYAETLSMSDEEFTRQQDIRNKLRGFLQSLISK